MRRVYHRFPQRCDLDFEIGRPFSDVVEKVILMNGTHVTNRAGEDLVRLDLKISVANEKTNLVPVDQIPSLLEKISETADFQIILNETILTGERKIPRSATVYYLRLIEKGMSTECFVAKEGNGGNTDAYDIKKLIAGAF
ncbi:hypothetical protein F1737_01940 [Methanoplanus sp. FWC-SCC4]|uniref:Uncharacterized protein n=1 Tax=Methanochimaera problematica TaxID=2609417 RepID=A0AA97FDN1_9EURY|nr:hypothetical protein [Methanoplanus sp. FWC-SCC4]WOF15531.1 hypothetical protein F1737_01940 [Methanoplanus sp. FWC-SCC4]